jgi:hypothetical protein
MAVVGAHEKGAFHPQSSTLSPRPKIGVHLSASARIARTASTAVAHCFPLGKGRHQLASEPHGEFVQSWKAVVRLR